MLLSILGTEPIYEPDDLTELGRLQAEAVAKRLAEIGVDKIYASTSNRAIQTAVPTAKLLGKEITLLDFANESHPWENLTIKTPFGKKTWLYQAQETIDLFYTKEIADLGFDWYLHPKIYKASFPEEMKRIQTENNAFFASLGYQALGNGKYRVIGTMTIMWPCLPIRVLLLSLLLNIPYPYFCTRFEIGHAEITLIEFKNVADSGIPKSDRFPTAVIADCFEP